MFDVRWISSSSDLEKSLGINVEASYGCGAVGAGASGRFGFVEQSAVHSATLFMTVTATVQLPDLSIDEPTLTDKAKGQVGNPKVFKARYGDLFCRACTRGGLFVGVMRFETYDAEETNTIEGTLRGPYGSQELSRGPAVIVGVTRASPSPASGASPRERPTMSGVP